MNWRDFKVFSIYGAIVCVVLFFLGQRELAIIPIIIYPIYGLISIIKKYRKKKKLNTQLDSVPDYMKNIVICHIMYRNKKISKKNRKQIIEDILNGDYKIETFDLIEKRTTESGSDDSYSRDYYLKFNNGKEYQVIKSDYNSSNIGDRLFEVTTSTDKMMCIKTKNEYINMFTV